MKLTELDFDVHNLYFCGSKLKKYILGVGLEFFGEPSRFFRNQNF